MECEVAVDQCLEPNRISSDEESDIFYDSDQIFRLTRSLLTLKRPLLRSMSIVLLLIFSPFVYVMMDLDPTLDLKNCNLKIWNLNLRLYWSTANFTTVKILHCHYPVDSAIRPSYNRPLCNCTWKFVYMCESQHTCSFAHKKVLMINLTILLAEPYKYSRRNS